MCSGEYFLRNYGCPAHETIGRSPVQRGSLASFYRVKGIFCLTYIKEDDTVKA